MQRISKACPNDLPTGGVASPGPFPLAIHEVEMDIVGPLPWAPGKAQYILHRSDYFSKWVEADAFEKVRKKEVIDFIWDHIICRFGIQTEITCDNERQFIGRKTTKFFEDYQIKKLLSTPYHPSVNCQG
ncbi:uncharacterized protein [Nicotiana tomentosiformis]|uniref:uncharacterized protein n=1 Tax=Nicotiana tomentosiformis TaxID=4098 RepID=UPI00388CB683